LTNYTYYNNEKKAVNFTEEKISEEEKEAATFKLWSMNQVISLRFCLHIRYSKNSNFREDVREIGRIKILFHRKTFSHCAKLDRMVKGFLECCRQQTASLARRNSLSRDGLSNLRQTLIARIEKVKIDFRDIADANEKSATGTKGWYHQLTPGRC